MAFFSLGPGRRGALAFDVLILYNGELCTVKKNWEIFRILVQSHIYEENSPNTTKYSHFLTKEETFLYYMVFAALCASFILDSFTRKTERCASPPLPVAASCSSYLTLYTCLPSRLMILEKIRENFQFGKNPRTNKAAFPTDTKLYAQSRHGFS